MTPRSLTEWVLLGLGALLLAPLALGPSEFYRGLGPAAMLALSLQLLVGCTGLVSLGHAAFYGLGAYTVYAMTPAEHGLSLLMTLPAAALVAGLAALLVGALSLRAKGFFFLMVTLAFGQMVFFIFHNTKLGGGADGAYLMRPTLSVFDWQLTLTRRQRPLAIYYLTLVLLVAMYLALCGLLRTLFGRVLDGIRINEPRMLALGFNTYRYKLAAFAIAGVLAGVAGHMYAMKDAFVNPALVGWHRSAEALLMLLLGGLGSLNGAVIGALAYTAIGEAAQLLTEGKPLGEGVVILLVVLSLPNRQSGLTMPAWPTRDLRRHRTTPAEAPEVGRHG